MYLKSANSITHFTRWRTRGGKVDECLSDREIFRAKDLAERNETKLLHVLRVMVTMKQERERERECDAMAVTRAHW